MSETKVSRFDEVPKFIRELYNSIRRYNFRFGVFRWNNKNVLHDWIRMRGYIIMASPFERLPATKDITYVHGDVAFHIDTEWRPIEYLVTGNVFPSFKRDVIYPEEFEVYSLKDVSLSDVKLIEYSEDDEPIVMEFIKEVEKLGYRIKTRILSYPEDIIYKAIINRAILNSLISYDMNVIRESYAYFNGRKQLIYAGHYPIDVFIGWLWNEDHGLRTPDKVEFQWSKPTITSRTVFDIIVRRVEGAIRKHEFLTSKRRESLYRERLPLIIIDYVKKHTLEVYGSEKPLIPLK